METTEKNINDSPCELRRFMHSFVMEVFVERVKGELASRIEGALRGGEAVRVSTNKVREEIEYLIIKAYFNFRRFFLLVKKYSICVKKFKI